MDEVIRDANARMQASLEALGRELRSVRTGRANISILDDLLVEYYGTSTPINQLASLSVPDPQLIVVQPYDKTAIGDIERTILQADLGLNPSNDGAVVRVPIPELTEERRKEMAKHAGALAEEGKTEVRQARRDANESIKKLEHDKAISQDDEHRGYDKVQDLTKVYCERIDQAAAAKQSELLEI